MSDAAAIAALPYPEGEFCLVREYDLREKTRKGWQLVKILRAPRIEYETTTVPNPAKALAIAMKAEDIGDLKDEVELSNALVLNELKFLLFKPNSVFSWEKEKENLRAQITELFNEARASKRAVLKAEDEVANAQDVQQRVEKAATSLATSLREAVAARDIAIHDGANLAEYLNDANKRIVALEAELASQGDRFSDVGEFAEEPSVAEEDEEEDGRIWV
jgi:hypothetical protein